MSTTETNDRFHTELTMEILEKLVQHIGLNEVYLSRDNGPVGFKLSEKFSGVEWKQLRWGVLTFLIKCKSIERVKGAKGVKGIKGWVASLEGKNLFERDRQGLERKLQKMWKEYERLLELTTEDYEKLIIDWYNNPRQNPRAVENSRKILAKYGRYYPNGFLPSKKMAKWIIECDNRKDGLDPKCVPATMGSLATAFRKKLELPKHFKLNIFAAWNDGYRLLPKFKEALDNLHEKKIIDLDAWEIIKFKPPSNTKPSKPLSTSSSASHDVSKTEMIDRITEILDYKGQIVLYGPPGTGKTYLANEYVNGKKHVFRCTFHPEYGYEHFIEGFRPENSKDGTQMIFKLRSGIFKEICEKARKNYEEKIGKKEEPDKFYLLIDEINRGDIPRIFGELITLIEKDKRKPEHGVLLPHSRNRNEAEGEQERKFWVPPNVYIIATMNTADRSIALLDTALRRRFGFLEMKPEYHHFEKIRVEESLKDKSKQPCDLAVWFKELNEKLQEVLKENRHDAEHILIGHSYFIMPKDDDGKSGELTGKHFEKIIRHEIIPLLEEYCYEDKDAFKELNDFLGKTTGIAKDAGTVPPAQGDEGDNEEEDGEEDG